MDKTPVYFGEAKALCEEYGLLPLMEFNHVVDEDIVAQFMPLFTSARPVIGSLFG
jgi:hypothetical protein